jgi:hypothetical protein
MSQAIRGDLAPLAYRMVHWEDLANAASRRYGPLSVSSELLEQLLEMSGEVHPIHKSDRFALSVGLERRSVPPGLLQSLTSGWAVRHGFAVALVNVRSAAWDFVRPLYPDQPFFFTNATIGSSEIDDSLGLVSTERRIFDESGEVYAVGRIDMVMLRRGQRGISEAAKSFRKARAQRRANSQRADR